MKQKIRKCNEKPFAKNQLLKEKAHRKEKEPLYQI
jgi:hypothetical protein